MKEKFLDYVSVVAGLYEQLLTLDIYSKMFYVMAITSLIVTWFIILKADKLMWKGLAVVLNLILCFAVGHTVGNYYYVIPGLLEFPSFIIGTVMFGIDGVIKPSAKEKIYQVVYRTSSGTVPIDFRRHGGIFGGSGAGKTDSIYVPMLSHIFRWRAPAAVYDYKDFELWEKTLYFYEQARKENLALQAKGKKIKPLQDIRCIYLNDPNLSDHLNFLDPMYLQDIEDCEAITNALFDNLYPSSGNDENIWKDSGAAVFAGVAWRTKEDYPEYSTFPIVSQIILTYSAEVIMAYIKKSSRARTLAAPFLKAEGNDKQLGSIISSVASALKKIATPNMYTILSRNDFDIGINKDGNHTVLGLINEPTRDSVYSPVIATITQLMMLRISKRRREYTYLVLDEASTLKFNRLDKVLATLRTFKIMVAWGLQDKVQGAILYSDNVLKAILANLGVKMIGKANDPDTATYYSKLFETVDVTERSVTESSGRKSVTSHVKEKGKYKIMDFQRLDQGEFFFLDTKSNDKLGRVKLTPYEDIKPEQKHYYSREEIEDNFDKAVEQAKQLIIQDLGSDTEETDAEASDDTTEGIAEQA